MNMYDARFKETEGHRTAEFSAAIGNDIELIVPLQLPGTFPNRQDSQELFKRFLFGRNPVHNTA